MPSTAVPVSAPFISVVVPAYNQEKFLATCIRSILAQTFQAFEVCLVDDGSTDGTPALADELAGQDSRIHVCHTGNGGVTAARRIGTGHARGEWVTFLDADDTLPPDALQRFAASTSADTDIVVGSFSHKRRWLRRTCPPGRYRKRLIAGRFNIGAVGGKLFRRALLMDSVFAFPKEIVMGEDLLMNLRIAFSTHKPVRFLAGRVYNYVQHGESITHTFRNSTDYEYLYNRERERVIPLPLRAEYLPATIYRRLRMLRRIRRHGDPPPGGNWVGTPLVGDLLADIRTAHYPLAWRDRYILSDGKGGSLFRAWISFRLSLFR